jgi:cyclic-di-GMP-binding protein
MTLDALRLEVPELLDEAPHALSELNGQLNQARQETPENGLQHCLGLLFRLNRSATTLLERQRALQSFSDEYRHYASAFAASQPPSSLFIRLCDELASGFKRLLLQVLQGRQPSRPHLAWCLYMAQHFLAQSLLRHYQLYREPPAALWRDCHLLYWIGEQQQCLDEPVAAAFNPQPANTLRGLYQQMLLLAQSNPFHLAEGECLQLFSALSPLAELARLQPWDEEDDSDAALVDLSEAQPCLSYGQQLDDHRHLRRFELGALLVAVQDPSPLQSPHQRDLLERASRHWQGRQQRRHERTEHSRECRLVVGLGAIHAQLLEQRPSQSSALILDASPGGARLLCNPDSALQLPVGQLLLLLTGSETPTLALIRWRHSNDEGLHLGLRYLKGLPRPVWLRRTPSSQPHVAVLQSTPAPGSGWHHGLWLGNGQFSSAEQLWLQLANSHSQTALTLPESNLNSPMVSRYPLRLA